MHCTVSYENFSLFYHSSQRFILYIVRKELRSIEQKKHNRIFMPHKKEQEKLKCLKKAISSDSEI